MPPCHLVLFWWEVQIVHSQQPYLIDPPGSRAMNYEQNLHSAWDSECVTFSHAVTTCLTEGSSNKDRPMVRLTLYRDIVQQGWKDMVAGGGGRCSHCIHSQETGMKPP